MNEQSNNPSTDKSAGRPIAIQRRSVLQITAALAAASSAALPSAHAEAAAGPAPTGQPGDFNFLSGQWKIQQKRRKDGTWDHFEGEATVYGILNGVVSVEELRIPSRNFSGMGLRILDRPRKLWADYWVNSQSGVLTPPPTWGSFVAGVGIWDSDDTEGEKPITVRGAWDQITPTSCRWYQAVSSDNGKTWQDNWVMNWRRV
jgi:hypothetical protein